MGNNSTNGRAVKSISKKLSLIFAIMLVISMVAAELIVIGFGYGMVNDRIHSSLKNEVSTDAGMVHRELNATFYYLNGVGDALEKNTFANNDEIRDYLASSVGRYALIPTGTYLALNDGTFLYPADPSIEDQFDTLNSAWYIETMGYTNSWFYFYDKPYFDNATGLLCATVERKVTLKDGRQGAFVADLMMGSVQETLNGITLYADSIDDLKKKGVNFPGEALTSDGKNAIILSSSVDVIVPKKIRYSSPGAAVDPEDDRHASVSVENGKNALIIY